MSAAAQGWLAKIYDPWEWLGLGAQLCFTGRFVYQWWRSEKAKAVVLPRAFWYLSLAGAISTLIYALHIGSLALVAAQSVALFFYLRSLAIQRATTEK